MKKYKISFIEPHLMLFGGIRRVIELSNQLVKNGHDVTIYHSDGKPCEWMQGLAKTLPAEKVVEKEHDVLIFNDPNSKDIILASKTKSKLKIFYILALYDKRFLTVKVPKTTKYNPFAAREEKSRSKRILSCLNNPENILVGNASWVNSWLQENLGLACETLIGGINQDMFRPIAVEKNQNEIVILTSGDPRKRKGYETVKKAIAILTNKYPNLKVKTYYGKGIPQKEMAKLYSSADIFLDAQWYGGWNNPVAEAMACRTAVVCTNIGAIEDYAFHNKTALLCEVKNPSDMAEKTEKLIENNKLRQKISTAGYNQIKKFTWEKSANNLEKIIRKYLKQ